MFHDVSRKSGQLFDPSESNSSNQKSIGQLFDDIASDCPNMNKHEEDLQLQQIKN
jgi:hypothetical protein